MSLAGTAQDCNTRGLVPWLAERGLMSYGQDNPDELTERNQDRVRILRYVSMHPDGVTQNAITHDAVKGVDEHSWLGHYDFDNPGDAGRVWTAAGEWVALDGSDPDYQFVNRYINALDDKTDLLRVEHGEDRETRVVFPTPALLDLISEGTTETPTLKDDLVFDREFCQNLLKSKRSDLKRLSDSEKEHLAGSLRRYIQRIRDYRLAFDVHLADRDGYESRRMTKLFKTRFSDPGRIDKQFAMLQDSLEWGAEHADTAVFCTLTTAPRQFDSLYDSVMDINPNFHNLTQWLKSDPSTVSDTRKEDVPAWRPELDSSEYEYFPDGNPTGGPPEGPVSGRPREKLEYVKVLEWTEAGYPHLHVLFFDPPRRESDGMPWLVDKHELEHKWNQAQIVDCYPLVYRDDLDEIDRANFNADEGFVSWYRYSDHDHNQEWIEDRSKQHDQIDFDGDDADSYEKTAGSYIGKYISETYGLLQNLESLDDPDFDVEGDEDSKSSWWKLAMYWCTNRRIWTPSRRIRRDIRLDDDRADVRRGVTDVTRTSLLRLTDDLDDDHHLYPSPSEDVQRSYLHRLVRDMVADADVADQRAHENATSLARVEYLGAYHVDDLPAPPSRRVDPEPFEDTVHDPDSDLVLHTTGDRPPPILDAWD